MKNKSKHLFFIRLIVGVCLFFFGFYHLVNNQNFTNLLRVAEFPMVYFNVVFIPLTDFLIGLFLILGLFTRFSAAIGVLSTVLLTWVSIFIIQMDPSQLPDDLTQKPFHPPIFLGIIVGIFSLYLLCFGSGAYSLDNRLKK